MMTNFSFSKCFATTVVDCIEYSFEKTCLEYSSVRNRIADKQRKFGINVEYSDPKYFSNLLGGQYLELLEPCVHPGVTKLLIMETNSRWVCALANGQHGINTIPHIEMCAESVKTRYVRAVVDETKGAESFQFLYRDFTSSDANYRYIYAQNEGAWSFSASGQKLPFEEESNYALRKKRDRLPPILISQYMGALGIPLNSSNFFTGKVALFNYPPFPQTKPIPS